MINQSFIAYAMRHYDNPACKTIETFKEDVNRFGWIKRLFTRFMENPEAVSIRLMVNHIIITYNVFDQYACTVMLFYKTPREHWGILTAILDYMSMTPEWIPELNLNTTNIVRDQRIVKEIESW